MVSVRVLSWEGKCIVKSKLRDTGMITGVGFMTSLLFDLYISLLNTFDFNSKNF